MIELRVCRECLQEKSLDLFKKDSHGSRGYTRLCKDCANAANKRYRAANKEKRKQYLADNADHIREVAKQYREAHKETIRELVANYRLTHKEDRKQYLQANRDKINSQHRDFYRSHVVIEKRCPDCRKHFKFQRYYAVKHPYFKCPYCRIELRRGKTLSDTHHRNTHGFRIKVI